VHKGYQSEPNQSSVSYDILEAMSFSQQGKEDDNHNMFVTNLAQYQQYKEILEE